MPDFVHKIFVGITVAVVLFATPFFASAQDKYGTEATRGAAGLPTTVAGAGTIPEVIGAMVGIVLSLLGIVFFGLIFYAGFEWMTAQGNSTKVDSAKSTIITSVFGLIIVLAAYAITNFVFTNLSPGGGTPGCTNRTPPPQGQSCLTKCSTVHDSEGACRRDDCCEWK